MIERTWNLRAPARSVWVLTAILLVAACGSSREPSVRTLPPPPIVSVSNSTTLVVTIAVNGRLIGAFLPGGRAAPVSRTNLPPLPWHVEGRAPSGRVLVTMDVTVQDLAPNDPGDHHVPMGRVDLPCGRLTIWAGDLAPSDAAPPAPAQFPVDCGT